MPLDKPAAAAAPAPLAPALAPDTTAVMARSPAAPPVAPVAQAAQAAQVAQAAPPPVPPAAAIAPAPVVDLGGRRPEPEMKPCPRCKGVSPATAQFCRFCGASLAASTASATSSLPTPAVAQPSPIAPPPVPAAAPTAVAPTAPAPVAPPRPVAPPLPNPGAKPKLDITLVSEPPLHEPAPAPIEAAPAKPTAPFEVEEHTAQIAAFQGATAPRGRLVLIARDGGAGPSHPILDQLDIGRTEGDVLVPDDRTLGARHARITRRGSALFVKDLGTVNGIYKRLRPGPAGAAKLRDQDLILVGQQVLRFEIVKEGEDGLGPAHQHGTLLFGTPVIPLYARLCQRTTAGITRDVYHLHKVETVLGRESGDIVFTDDPFLSRKHAAIHVERKGETIEGSLADMESSNGTFLKIHGEVELYDGDELRLGQQLFRVDLSGTELSSTIRSERGTG